MNTVFQRFNKRTESLTVEVIFQIVLHSFNTVLKPLTIGAISVIFTDSIASFIGQIEINSQRRKLVQRKLYFIFL